MAVASFSLLRGDERQEDTSSDISWTSNPFMGIGSKILTGPQVWQALLQVAQLEELFRRSRRSLCHLRCPLPGPIKEGIRIVADKSAKSKRAWSTCVKSTLGSFPCTEQIFSQISSQPACIDNIWRGVTHEALVQFENILREHQLKLFRPHTFSWKLSARSKLSPSDHTIRVSCCF